MNPEKIAQHFDLTGKVILVTGGSRGLGFEMCRAFALAGATTIVSSRKQDSCDRAAEAINEETGQECLPLAGPFLTDIADAWSDEIKAAIGAVVPLGRAGQPEEIVGVALYLASDASRYSNGSVIKVDGGMAYGN